MTISITYRQTPLTAEGTFFAGYPDTMTDPGEADSFELGRVISRCGDDLTSLITEDQGMEIEELCLQAIQSIRKFEREENRRAG